MGDGNGTVAITARPGFVWVRINGIKAAAYNARVQNIEDLAVWAGYDPVEPQMFQVLGLRHVYKDTDLPAFAAIGPHHASHEWESVTGSDMVYVHLRQWMPLRVGVSSGLTVEVNGGINPTATGEWSFVAYQTLDLSGDLPATGACWALIYLDDGTLARRLGNRVPSLAALSVENIPALQSGERALAAVKLYAGQTGIQDDAHHREILDLRYPQPADRTPLTLEAAVCYENSVVCCENEIVWYI
jgi:hypothetical protein